MTFSTRNNPRLAQSGVALTSLGAVGGARGTAAGALRIFVEFLSQYDGDAVKQIEQDLENLNRQSEASSKAETRRRRSLAQLESRVRESRLVERRLDRDSRRDLAEIESLERSRTKANRERAVVLRGELETRLKVAGFQNSEISVLRTRVRDEDKIVRLKREQEKSEARTVQRQRQINSLNVERGRIEQFRTGIGARLGGLAIGALGGIFGGALLGVGFAAAEAGIEAVGEAILNLVDPSRKARENVKALAEEVNNLASQEKITQLQAAQRIVGQFGLPPQQAGQFAQSVAEAAARQSAVEAVQKELDALEVLNHEKGLEDDLRKRVTDAVRLEAQASGEYSRKQAGLISVGKGALPVFKEYVGDLELQAVVEQRLTALIEQHTDAAYENAKALMAQAAAAQQAAALAAVAANVFQDAVQAAASVQIGGIDDKISNLPTESARTKGLEAQLEAAQNAQGRASDAEARARTLRDINEQRSLILLKQRLKLLGTAINLEEYEGKFLLAAIDAKIAAMNKEASAQDRLNRLLDLQFRASQKLRRQTGESIQDFQERQAKEGRDILSEQRDIEREATIERLEELRDKTQDEVDLAELAERKVEALRKRGTSDHLSNLRKQLEASREADRKALQSKREALEKEKKAIQDKVREALRLASDQSIAETKLAIQGADKLQDWNKISGRIAGLRRAKATIQALVEGFGLPAFIAQPFLDKLNKLIGEADAKLEGVRQRTLPKGAPVAFASGGVIPLRNSSTPFGQNVRLGEQGTELGVILSNRVTQALRESQMGPSQVGPFILESRDPLRDQFYFKRLVRDAVQEAMRR